MTSTSELTPVLQSALERIGDVAHEELVGAIRGGARVISVSGLVSEPVRALTLAALQRATGKPFAIVTQANRDLEAWERDLRFWYGALHGKTECDDQILLLPSSESDPYAGSSPHTETLEQRASTLWQITQGAPDFVLLTARALARKTVAPSAIAQSGTVLERDADHAPEELVEKLIASGYMREDPISGIGEFSMRGGILDVW